MRMGMRVPLIALVAIGVVACKVGPNYQRPVVDTPSAWRIDYPKAADVADTKWWEQFGDPALNELIDSALHENLDVRIAAARIDQFIGALVATRSQLFPQIGYGADVSRAQASRVGVPPIPPGGDPYFTLYQASLGTAWQVDLFGRVQRLTEAAQAQVYASEQAKRGVVLSLVTGVAANYVALRALDRQLEVAQATARNFGETARIFDLRFNAGIVSMTEVVQIRSQYKQALAAIPAFEQAIAAQENFICILLGRNPQPIARGKSIDELVPPAIPADLPSALLQRRPDIMQAEQNLIAANANIGATRALYYPNLSLTGALGSASTDIGDFLTGPARAWLLGAGVTGPIFTFGGLSGQLYSAQAQEKQSLYFYQQTILNAFREANDALVGSQKKIEEVEIQAQRVDALREFARLSRLKFDSGVAGYLEVLIAENELFAAELSTVSLRAARYTQLIDVYRAMGGGWVDIANSLTPQPQGIAAAQSLR
jgi:multidrug efflux system outer membrane protein